jgi:hypothetical protein
MKAVILHLSDIHIQTDKDPILRHGKEIAATTFEHLPSASHVFIVCTGDVANSGTHEEYASALSLFADIEEAIRKESRCEINFVFSPGNHDCNFNKNSQARELLVNQLEKKDSIEVDESVINICTEIQEEFFTFRDSIENNSNVTDDKLWRTSYYKVEGKTIAFDCLNISWASQINEKVGRLFFPIDCYANKSLENTDFRFVILHHPLNWLHPNSYRPFRNFIRKLASIVISGHEHQGTAGLIEDAESGTSGYIEGCELQSASRNITNSSFNVVVIDLHAEQSLSTIYKWNGTRYSAKETGSLHCFSSLPAKKNNSLSIAKNFQETLDDPGAFLVHPGKDRVILSDIYVYPDLYNKAENKEEQRRPLENSRLLLEPEATKGGILIEGEEKTGRTSLLYQLYREYHERGFVPLYIRGKDIKKSTDNEIDKLLKRAIAEQYGKEQVENFIQHTHVQKLLLIDDFDDSQMHAGEARARLLSELSKRFSHLVVTVGEMFEMREMLEVDTSHALNTLTHFKIQPFGYVKRAELIKKWHSLGIQGVQDESRSENGRIARLDHAEKLMDSVMQKGIIPATPLYLLTLLQTIDTNRIEDLKASALGEYYHYLLAKAFQAAGVKPDKLTEFFQYSMHLAWEFHKQGKPELSELDLRSFNTIFSENFHTVDFSERRDMLLDARILRRVGDDYAFRYPYIYYYLKGEFLSENLSSNIGIQIYIKHCCQHLYVRDYANTVLFLAHHSNDDFVLNAIVDAINNLFKEKSAVSFINDTETICALIKDAPKLKISVGKPVDHRAERNKFQDEFDDGRDGLLESEEDAEELSLIAKITMLHKTTEILGQVLKNQYSRIQRSKRQVLLNDLFNGPLRAIRHFYDYLESNHEILISEIEEKLKLKNKSSDEFKTFARRIVASFVCLVTAGFLMNTARCVNSESLQEDIRDIIKKTNTPAFRLIKLACELDSYRPIPKGLLGPLYIDVSKDLIACRALQIMVVNRLYMFKTPERDMQWLNEKVKIDLEFQHLIASQEKGMRRLSNRSG